MRVEQVMTKDVLSCSVDDPLSDAAQILWERDCGAVPVTTRASERVVGMLTDRDICMAARVSGRALPQLQVSDAMSCGVRACRADDTVADAEALMRSAQVRRLPVVDDAGHLAGIVSIADLARVFQESGGVPLDAPQLATLLVAVSAPRSAAARSARSFE
jgi:CBS-domain-containing membrane protein